MRVDTITRRCADRFSDIRKFVTTASPKGMAVKRGDGLQGLLLYWLNVGAPEPVVPVRAASDRVFASLRPRED
jgi:hypothetical protein